MFSVRWGCLKVFEVAQDGIWCYGAQQNPEM
jgi:hypothetical protein